MTVMARVLAVSERRSVARRCGLAIGQRLRLGEVELEVSAVCDPCEQIEALRPGLRAEIRDGGHVVPRAGVQRCSVARSLSCKRKR